MDLRTIREAAKGVCHYSSQCVRPFWPGCGADAAFYFRVFNTALQAAKFDPRGDYIRRWVPESAASEYSPPIVNHAQARARALIYCYLVYPLHQLVFAGMLRGITHAAEHPSGRA